MNIDFISIFRALLGIAFFLGVMYLLSENRKKIDFKLVGAGIVLQLVFAILILKVSIVAKGFDLISKGFVKITSFTEAGSDFLFGSLINLDHSGFIFAFKVLPTVVFFSALSSLLYYLGILQKIVYAFAWVMSKTMRMSGAESLAAAANIFIGQTEAPLVVKPYLDKMTNSEILCLMVGGMATIAGGVLAAYVQFLGGADTAMQVLFAKHLLAASIMSAPAAILCAKMLVPETQEVDKNLNISKEKIGSNVLEAITNGTTDGLKLAVNVGAMLLVFIAFMAALNYFFMKFGALTHLNDTIARISDGKFDKLSLEFIFGVIFAPVAWLMGVPKADLMNVGQLLGQKTILNEFVAYLSLGNLKSAGAFTSEKSVIIATYALCGFANFASIGIQIGGIGTLAPNKKALLSKYGIKALIGGTIACFLTATIAGMLV